MAERCGYCAGGVKTTWLQMWMWIAQLLFKEHKTFGLGFSVFFPWDSETRSFKSNII